MLDFLLENFTPEWEKSTGSASPIVGIHVWKAVLHDHAANLKNFQSSLSEAEIDRAERFRLDAIRQRFILAHGIVRQVLGSYLNLPASALEFARLPSGKPLLAENSGFHFPAIKFNISHSEDLLLMAVSQEYESGIDVEWIKPGFQHSTISENFFAEAEKNWLQLLAPGEQAEAFFRLWTCKEAVLKADGSGLRRKLEYVKIEFDAEKKLVRGLPDSSNSGEAVWAVQSFAPEPGYTAALAFNLNASAAEFPVLKFFRWIS